MSPDLPLWLWTGAATAWWGTACLLSRPLPPSPPSSPAGRLSISAFRAIPRLSGPLPGDWSDSLRGLASQLRPDDQLLVACWPQDEEILSRRLALLKEEGVVCEMTLLPRSEAVRWPNPKIDSYFQLASHARHALWFWSDCDISFPSHSLDSLLRNWTEIPAGFITCLYRVRAVPSARALPEALFVNAEFFPGARILARTDRLQCAFGAGILFEPPVGKMHDFWREIGSCLADDYALGKFLGSGRSAPFYAEATAHETTWIGALSHYYRWQKTIRWCEPLGFAGQIVLHPSLGWVLWLLLGGGAAAFRGLSATVLLETAAAILLLPCLPLWHRVAWLPFLPAWGLLRSSCWIATWLPIPVLWRGKLWWQPRAPAL